MHSRQPAFVPDDAFRAAVRRALEGRARREASLRTVARIPAEGLAGLAKARSSSSSAASRGGGGVVSRVDVDASCSSFLKALGFREARVPSGGAASFSSDRLAQYLASAALAGGSLSCAPALVFGRRPGLAAGARGGEGVFALAADSEATHVLGRLLGAAASTDGSLVLRPGPRLAVLLPFADAKAADRIALDLGGSTMFAHAASGPVAPPFLFLNRDKGRFVFVDDADGSLRPHLLASGFREGVDGSFSSSAPVSAFIMREFADPALAETIREVYARWPFVDDGFTLDDFEAAASDESGGGGGRAKPAGEEAAGWLSYDPAMGMFATRDGGEAAAAGLPLLARGEADAFCDGLGAPRKAAFGTPFLSEALRLRESADDSAEFEILCRLVEAAAKPALPLSWRPPDPASPFSYDEDQVEGIRFAMRSPCISLADEMGIGKSFEASGVCDAVRRDVNPDPLILYVLPASQRDSMTVVLSTAPSSPFSVRRLDQIGVERPASNVERTSPAAFATRSGRGAICVVSYETLVESPCLAAVVWDLVVFDECHMIKNVEAARTAAVIDPVGDGGMRSARFLFMSGTQITNTMADYWPFLKTLLRGAVTPLPRFRRLFAARKGNAGDESRRLARAARFSRAMDRGVRLRRTKDELGKTPGKLPMEVESIAVDDPDVLVEVAREAELYDLFEATADARGKVRIRSEIDVIRKRTARAKIPRVSEALKDVAAEEPFVAFVHHVEVADVLGDALKALGVDVLVLHGKNSSPRRRFQLIEEFQAGRYAGIVATMSSCGVGYTMTRARFCAMVELDWKVHIVMQAPDRLDRRTSKPADPVGEQQNDRRVLTNAGRQPQQLRPGNPIGLGNQTLRAQPFDEGGGRRDALTRLRLKIAAVQFDTMVSSHRNDSQHTHFQNVRILRIAANGLWIDRWFTGARVRCTHARLSSYSVVSHGLSSPQ